MTGNKKKEKLSKKRKENAVNEMILNDILLNSWIGAFLQQLMDANA